MASTLQTLTATIVLVSLLLECTEQVSGMRYGPISPAPAKSKHSPISPTPAKSKHSPISPTPARSKHSAILVNMAPQPSDIVPGFGRFLLPPKPKLPFLPYKDPRAAPPTTTSYSIPSNFAPKPGPGSGEVPPVPQPRIKICQQISIC